MKNKLFVICVVGAALIGSTKLSIARGFGGSHGGGFGGGGFGGGGFRGGGGFGGGGFAGGGFHGYGGGMGGGEIHAYSGGMGGGGFQRYGGGMGASQFNSYGGGLAASAYRGGGLGSFDSGLNAMRSNSSGAAMRSGSAGQFANSMANLPDSFREVSTALPTDMGMHSEASAASGYSGNASGLAARESNLSDAEISNSFAALGDSIASTERAATASVDAGERPQGVAAQQASGARNGTFAANAAQNGVRSPGNVAAQATRANTLAQAGDITRHLSPADLHVLGNKIRYDYVNPNDSAWYNAWGGVVLAAAQGAYSPWAPASWSGVNNWFGTNSPAISYDYGDELTYNNGNVVLNGQPIATAQQYWQAATNLVAQGQQAPPKGTQWLPLGMFAAIRGDEKNTNMLFELAVDKKGTVRGNYFNTSDKNSQPIAGAADKKTQRISWVVEDRKDIVFDTGLYNLTKDETVALVHFGKDKTEQWTFVRLKKNNKK